MAFGRFDPRKNGRREPQQRVGHRIRVPEVRVIDANGDMLGVMTTQDAIKRARDQGLDLVEINPKAVPPVCKILDYGRFKYEEKKKKRETKRKQSIVEIKEIKLRPKTDDHDLDFKMRAARRFIEGGNKVKFTVRFRGREITHPEKAREQLEWISQQCLDISTIEVRPMMEARTMSMIIAPKTMVLQKLAETRAVAEKERKKLEEARRAAKAAGGSAPGASQPGSHPGEDDYDDDLDDDDDDDDLDDDSEDEDELVEQATGVER
jgi:translation initiation factor IF-3